MVFREQLALWGVELTEAQAAGLRRFAYLLSSYAEANVIGTRSLERILEDHILDSLSCLLFEGFEDGSRLIDVGAGAGLPGIPLKLARPCIALTLLESTAKKTRFINHAVVELGILGASVITGRAEEVARQEGHRGSYDVATARALASLAVVAEYCVPLTRVGGHVVAMKGRITAEELEAGETAADRLGARVAEVISVPLLPQIRARDRCLVVLEKVDETPERYPRRTGLPKKLPLA